MNVFPILWLVQVRQEHGDESSGETASTEEQHESIRETPAPLRQDT